MGRAGPGQDDARRKWVPDNWRRQDDRRAMAAGGEGPREGRWLAVKTRRRSEAAKGQVGLVRFTSSKEARESCLPFQRKAGGPRSASCRPLGALEPSTRPGRRGQCCGAGTKGDRRAASLSLSLSLFLSLVGAQWQPFQSFVRVVVVALLAVVLATAVVVAVAVRAEQRSREEKSNCRTSRRARWSASVDSSQVRREDE